MGRHGTARVAKAVLLSAIPPLMLRTDANPEGLPKSVFDEIRAGVHGVAGQAGRVLAAVHDGRHQVRVRLHRATLKVYPGAPHGLTGDHEREFNADLLAFLAG
jgi:non-heme chloroperoxidase